MLKKTVTYVDYDGNERTETLHFNLTRAELAEMELATPGGLQARMTRIVNEKDTNKLIQLIKDFIVKSYGVKSDDGKKFIKSEELTRDFMQTEAYSSVFMEMVTDEKALGLFLLGIVPKDLANEVAKHQNKLGE